jgi:uncharacterized protein
MKSFDILMKKTMKILHFSDKSDSDFLRLYDECNVVITTGDLHFQDLVPLEQMAEKKPAFGVLGNHDVGQKLENFGIIDLHKKTYEFNGLLWGGFQGCLKYKNSDLMYTEQEAAEFARTFPYVDILLLHAGPYGMLDDPSDTVHMGSKSIRKYVEEKKPKVVFVGHQYSNDFMDTGDTKLFRTYGARIIELPY